MHTKTVRSLKTASYILASLTLTSALIACGSSPKQEAAAPARVLPTTLEEAVSNSTYRAEENKKRDQYRHPLETLGFFGITPEMTVIEISPGAGWYMEILAPYLAAKGHYIAAVLPADPSNAYFAEMHKKTTTWLQDRPEVSARVHTTEFAPPAKVDLAPEGTADMVVTFRNVHNWMTNNGEQAAFKAFFKALKPGGVLGVVEHRANAKAKRDPKAKSGYVREADVIRLAERAGFKLEAKSEINANAKDTKDHPEGVWTLPPTLRLKEKDQAKYLEIGESDRMTLKFVKPVKATKKN